MTLPLDCLRDSLHEIVSLAYSDKPPSYLINNFSETRLYNLSRGWGTLYLVCHILKETLLLEDAPRKPYEAVVLKIESSLEIAVKRAKAEMILFSRSIDLISKEVSQDFDKQYLIEFSNTFKYLYKSLKAPRHEKISLLFFEIFKGKYKSALCLSNKLSRIFRQQKFINFELYTRQSLPWRSFVADYDKEDYGLIVQDWVKSIFIPPESDWISPQRKKQWHQFILKKLSSVLPVVWEQLLIMHPQISEKSFSDWIVTIKRAGLKDTWIEKPKELKLAPLVPEGYQIALSSHLSDFPMELEHQKIFPPFLEVRRIHYIDTHCRGAIIEVLEPINPEDDLHVDAIAVLLHELAEGDFLPKTFHTWKIWKRELKAKNFGFSKEGDLKVNQPHFPEQFCIFNFMYFILDLAGGNWNNYCKIYKKANLRNTLWGEVINAFLIEILCPDQTIPRVRNAWLKTGQQEACYGRLSEQLEHFKREMLKLYKEHNMCCFEPYFSSSLFQPFLDEHISGIPNKRMMNNFILKFKERFSVRGIQDF